MSGNIYLLPTDCVNILFENVGVRARLILAYSVRSPSLIDQARKDAFRSKYGEFTRTEKELPIAGVIKRIRFSVETLPNAIALRVEEGLLKLKFKGEMKVGVIPLEETYLIYKKVRSILEGLNAYTEDFSPPLTLIEQRNIKRRRYRLLIMFNHYVRLYKETAYHCKFPDTIAATYRSIDTPPVNIGYCGNYLIYGTFFWDRKYEFYIRENGSLKCSFSLQYKVNELEFKLPRINLVQECHLAMLKVVAAIFIRQKQPIISIYHHINLLPLLYEVGLGVFSCNSEGALKSAKRQVKHLYELLNFTPAVQESYRLTTLYKKSMDVQMFDRMQACCNEIIFNCQSDLLF